MSIKSYSSETFKSKLATDDDNEIMCTICGQPCHNAPLNYECNICRVRVCIKCCGSYTSDFKIYCPNDFGRLLSNCKKIAQGHYYNYDLRSDFFINE